MKIKTLITSKKHQCNLCNSIKRKVDKICAHLTEGNVVHLGCGGGSNEWDTLLHTELCTRRKVTGVDIKGNVDIKADLNEDFPFGDNEWSNIIAPEIIEHLDNPLHFLKECRRVLKPTGVIIITTPNLRALNPVDCSDHIYGWDLNTFNNLSLEAGLDVKYREHYNGFSVRDAHLLVLGHIFGWIRPTLFFVLINN